jgi:type II secretory pathway pseudopilin PulG
MSRVEQALRCCRFCGAERGALLVEVVTVMAILVGVVGAIVVMMVSATRAEADLTQRVNAQQEARLALESMRRDVHCASAITVVDGGFVKLTMPSGCPTKPVSGTTVTWCTSGAGARWALRRVDSDTATCAGGRQAADFLTRQDVFTYQGPTATSLARLSVRFPVDIDPTDARRAYQLTDALVLRNSERTS